LTIESTASVRKRVYKRLRTADDTTSSRKVPNPRRELHAFRVKLTQFAVPHSSILPGFYSKSGLAQLMPRFFQQKMRLGFYEGQKENNVGFSRVGSDTRLGFDCATGASTQSTGAAHHGSKSRGKRVDNFNGHKRAVH